jgi:hypothetical protein
LAPTDLITNQVGDGVVSQMGFLDKYNPKATPQSARAWAIGGGIGYGLLGFLGWLLSWLREDMPFVFVFFIVPWMIIGGAIAGWAIEWQIPADCEEEAELGTRPDPARDKDSGSS